VEVGVVLVNQTLLVDSAREFLELEVEVFIGTFKQGPHVFVEPRRVIGVRGVFLMDQIIDLSQLEVAEVFGDLVAQLVALAHLVQQFFVEVGMLLQLLRIKNSTVFVYFTYQIMFKFVRIYIYISFIINIMVRVFRFVIF